FIEFEDQKHFRILDVTQRCPSIAYLSADNRCLKCPDGQTTAINRKMGSDKCLGCSINYRKIFDSPGNFSCKKCEDNFIAAITNNHDSSTCEIINNYDPIYILEEGKQLRCSDLIANSIGRDPGTLPISIFCKCPNNYPKVYQGNKKSKFECLDQSTLKNIIFLEILDYAVVNFVEFNEINYVFFNCDPYRDHFNPNEKCLCPPSYIFHNSKCKLCVDYEPEDKINKHHCVRCPEEKHLSLDGKSCMCPYSDKPQSAECGEPKENDMHCTGNLALINGSCQVCVRKKIKSSINGQCVCPYSEKLLDDFCNECDIESSSEINCKCGGNAEKIGTKCQCKNHQFLNSNNECIDCPKGYIRNKTHQNACICPEGKFINDSKICINCPRRIILIYSYKNKCKICPLLRNKSRNESDFNNFGVISFIIIMCLICFLVYYMIKTKCNKKNQNNQNRQFVTEYLGENNEAGFSNRRNNQNNVSNIRCTYEKGDYVNYEQSKKALSEEKLRTCENLNQMNSNDQIQPLVGENLRMKSKLKSNDDIDPSLRTQDDYETFGLLNENKKNFFKKEKSIKDINVE
ncbi:MAG: hypothetical protein MHPSP_003482, partial [Paramarteilia canceri]